MSKADASSNLKSGLSVSQQLTLILVAAALIRIWLLPSPGFVGDLAYFRSWAIEGAKLGVSALYEHMYCDYPPFYLYLLKVQGWLWLLFAGEAGYAESSAFASFLKLPSVLFDLAGAWLVFTSLRGRTSERAALIAAAAYALSPAMIFVSAYWGQIESILAFLYLLLAHLILQKRFGFAGALYLVCLATKAQAIVIAPILVAAALSTRRRALAEMAAGGLMAAALCFLPFILLRRMDIIIDNYVKLNDWYPYLSMNAFNIWWLAAGGEGTTIRDNGALLGPLTAKQIGVFLFCLAQGLIALAQYLRPVSMRSLCLGFILSLASFYMFPTQMHERYILPAVIFCAVLAGQSRVWMFSLNALSLIMAFNLAMALFVMYPEQAPSWWPAGDTLLLLTMAASALLLLFTLWAFEAYLREMKLRVWQISAVSLTLAGLLLLPKLLSADKPLRLVSIKPQHWEQQWGSLQKNRSVSGSRLWIGNMPFSEGYGTHTESRISFNLDGTYRNFRAYVGLDDAGCCGNEAYARIMADGELIWESEKMLCGRSAPQYVNLDVSGVETLELLGLPGDDGVNCDHLEWGQPVAAKD